MSSIASIDDLPPPQWDNDRDTITFPSWWKKFQAYAATQGFSEALEEDFAKKLPTKQENAFDEDDPVIKAEQERAIRKNLEAVFALLMAFTSESVMAMYFATQDDAWPGGLAWKVVKGIKEYYVPSEFVLRLEFKRRLTNVKRMRENENPQTLFEELAAIKETFEDASLDFMEEDLIVAVLDKAPKKYYTVIVVQMQLKKGQLTLNDLCRAMTNLYRSEMSRLNIDKKKKGKGKFKGKCNLCGKNGHKKADCWDAPENAEKRPDYCARKRRVNQSNRNVKKGASRQHLTQEYNLAMVC